MGFGRKSRHVIGGGDAVHGEDLNITPLLDLFVALISFLIMGAVMTKINVVNVGIAKPVANAVKKSEEDLGLTIKVHSAKGVEIRSKQKVWGTVAMNPENNWVQQVHDILVGVKQKHPGEVRMRLEPDGDVDLKHMMAIIDTGRELASSDPVIVYQNEKGEPLKLKYLFPNVILKGVY